MELKVFCLYLYDLLTKNCRVASLFSVLNASVNGETFLWVVHAVFYGSYIEIHA